MKCDFCGKPAKEYCYKCGWNYCEEHGECNLCNICEENSLCG